MAHDVYDDMFAIIVRPNKNMKHLNEEFVVKDLCKGKFPILVFFFIKTGHFIWSKMVVLESKVNSGSYDLICNKIFRKQFQISQGVR